MTSVVPLSEQIKNVTSYWSRVTLSVLSHLKYGHFITVHIAPIIYGFADWIYYPKCEDTTLFGHKGFVLCSVISSDGQSLFTGSYDNSIIHWDLLCNEILHRWAAHWNWVRDLDYHHSGLLVSVSDDWAVKLWDAHLHELVMNLTGNPCPMNRVCFSRDGQTVISSGIRDIVVWSVQSGKCLRKIVGDIGSVNAVISLGEGRILTGWTDSTLRNYDGIRHISSQSVGDAVLDLSLNCDGSLLACVTANSASVFQWPLMIGPVLRIHSIPLCGCFHPSNPVILALGTKNGPIEVYDVQIRVCLRLFKGHSNRAEQVCFTPNGTRLVSVSRDKTVRIWDTSFSLPLE